MTKRLVLQLLIPCLAVATLRADDWPQWRGLTRDGRWYETGIVERFESPRLQPLWTAKVAAGYTSPTVAVGRVYLSDRPEGPEEIERVLCLNAANGKTLWEYRYPCVYEKISYRAGPRAAITIADGRAYALGTMGNLHCFDAADGTVLWARDLRTEYDIRMPIWGISAAPVLVGPLCILHIGGKDNACIVALDRVTGKERWRALSDQANYSTPIIILQAGKPVLVCWTHSHVAGLDLATGKVLWETAIPEASRTIGVADPVYHGGRLLISDFWQGSLMLRCFRKRAAVERLWWRRGVSETQTDALHSLITTPILTDTSIYGVDSYGELRCLDAATGDRLWESLELLPKLRWGTIHMVRNGDKVWMFTEKGELAITTLSREGLHVISKTALIEPTKKQHPRGVVWSHPAFANRCIYVRNDEKILCASLAR